jgi:hypothetical protein
MIEFDFSAPVFSRTAVEKITFYCIHVLPPFARGGDNSVIRPRDTNPTVVLIGLWRASKSENKKASERANVPFGALVWDLLDYPIHGVLQKKFVISWNVSSQ